MAWYTLRTVHTVIHATAVWYKEILEFYIQLPVRIRYGFAFPFDFCSPLSTQMGERRRRAFNTYFRAVWIRAKIRIQNQFAGIEKYIYEISIYSWYSNHFRNLNSFVLFHYSCCSSVILQLWRLWLQNSYINPPPPHSLSGMFNAHAEPKPTTATIPQRLDNSKLMK